MGKPDERSDGCKGAVIPAICFEEVLEKSRLEITRRCPSWNRFPALYSRNESFALRAKAVSQKGPKERINFPSELKRYFKIRAPGLKYKKTLFGSHLFYKTLSDHVIFGIAFETVHHFGLGKAFTAAFVVEHPEGPFSGYLWLDNLFRVFGESPNWSPCWTYSTKDDLNIVFDSVGSLWDEIFPILEANTLEYFSHVTAQLPENIKLRGNITARQGLAEAHALALSWAPDATLVSISSGCLLSVREETGPAITPEGRLKPHGFWTYGYHSGELGSEMLFVRIPYAGTPCTNRHRHQGGFIGQVGYELLMENWIDSDRAMSVAEDNGGRSAREAAELNFDIIAKLGVPDSNPSGSHIWNIRYLIVKERNRRADFYVDMDPYTGDNIQIHQMET